MFARMLFVLGHQLGDSRFYPNYKKLMKNQWKPFSELRKEQEEQLRQMIIYSYNEVPYYHSLFKKLRLKPDDIRTIDDLSKLPILSKDTIKKNWDSFTPLNIKRIKYYSQSTGGSTGTPFKYRIDKFDRFLNGALWYRGWGYAGYNLGDKVVFMGGSSLGINLQSRFTKFANEAVRNIRQLSSFDMDESNLQNYVEIINRFKPKYMYGYASSLYFFANWIDENRIKIHSPQGVFSTSERLFPFMREKIVNLFGTDVYDTYGLNDGGVSAYECSEHCGMHIDTERAVMEVIDENDGPLERGEGKIIATSLFNYAMPFIRYDTGDIGHIIPEHCNCGREYILLREIIGRSVDFLVTPEGKNIHGWFFLYIFWKYYKGIKEYQVVQEKLDKIIIKIVPEEGFDERQIPKIRNCIMKRTKGWDIEFKIVDKIERTGAGKYKFVINNIT